MGTKFLRLPAVLATTGLSKTTLEAQVSKGQFPQPFKISERAIAWTVDDIEAWKAKKIATRPRQYKSIKRATRDSLKAATNG